jgi:flagellar basal body rod protein FlgB
MSMEIFDPTFVNLQHGIDRAAKKQAVIAQNIANATNPDYVAMDFDEALNKAVIRVNKKDVVLEEEMAALARNTGEHAAYVKLLTSKLNVIRTVATQGRR